MNYSTFLFDFDGTLVDSMPTFISTICRILDNNGFIYEDDFIKTITPLGLPGTAAYCVQRGLNMSEDEMLSMMINGLKEGYSQYIPAKSNVISTLKELKSQGCSLNVLTASPHDTLDPCLKRLGMWELFDNVWSCDDFHTTKADPNIYHMAAEKIGASVAEVLFLDDNLFSCQTAKKAGMGVCGVFDSSSEEYKDEIKTIADYYIDDFSELQQAFAR